MVFSKAIESCILQSRFPHFINKNWNKSLHRRVLPSLNTINLWNQCYQTRYLTLPSPELEGIPLEQIRNFGISAHVDSGKTTLTERILFYTGMIDQIHEIQGSDGVGAKMDHMELEKERGITIQSAATYTNWDLNGLRHHFNIIDTPGHVDFQIEVERALRILDGAVLVICGVNGVQSQTYTVERQMKRYSVPRICFINKLDRELSEPDRCLQLLRDKLQMNIVPIHVPIGSGRKFKGIVDVINCKAYVFEGGHGEKREQIEIPESLKEKVEDTRSQLIETLADVDEEFGDLYLESMDHCTEDAIHKALRRATIKRALVPAFLGTAKGNIGVQNLLDAVCRYLPHAGERPIEGYKITDSANPSSYESITVDINPKQKLIAMAFKIQDVLGYGTLTYVKIYQGVLRKGIQMIAAGTGKKLQWKKMYRMHSNEAEEIKIARAGDIVAVSGIEVFSGTTLADESASNVTLSNMHIPNTVISMAVSVDNSSDVTKFTKAIKRFEREDPTFKVHVDEESKQYLMYGMGELHLEIYTERMKREYGVQVKLGSPKVNLREVITQQHHFTYTHKRQHGGRGEWARISGRLETIDKSRLTLPNCEFINDQIGGGVPPNFITSLKKGFAEITQKGPLTGYPVLNLRFVLEDGETHEVDSSDQAFKNCMKYAFKEHFSQCCPAVLEPVMKVEIVTPCEYSQNLRTTLGGRGIQILDSKLEGEQSVFEAEAPLRCMFGFIADLRQITKGRGEFCMDFDRYQIFDGPELDKIMEDYRKNEKSIDNTV